uniref:Uncharacterized protein n=1 Tax=Anguilla anguilla TaxID=7936 RepID=A0A0E9SQZ9_ANGAN
MGKFGAFPVLSSRTAVHQGLIGLFWEGPMLVYCESVGFA